MATVKKKIWPQFFKLVKSGGKKAELRLADFKIKEGDTLVLAEWDPKKKAFTGREIRRKVKFLCHFHVNDFGQQKEIEKKGLYLIQF